MTHTTPKSSSSLALADDAVRRPVTDASRPAPIARGVACRCARTVVRLVAVLSLAWLAASCGPQPVPYVPPQQDGVDEGSMPVFELPTHDGRRVSLDEHRGKVVLVDFWATWCEPCKRSFPFYESLADRYGADGFVVLAVNVDEERAPVEAFLQTHTPSFTILLDPEHEVARQFGPSKMPTSYLIDRDGVVVDVFEGFDADEEAAVEQSVASLIDGTGASSDRRADESDDTTEDESDDDATDEHGPDAEGGRVDVF